MNKARPVRALFGYRNYIICMDSDSFMGKVGPLDEISGKIRVVSEIHSSAKGPFRILMGERMGKKFILKTLMEKYRNDPVFQLMMRKEFEIGFSLSHPGIARTVNLEEIEGLGECIVEEYIPGKSLEEMISQGSLKPEEVKRIAEGLIDAVGDLHSQQVIHNDLKPSNIIISDFDGRPRIIDFGYADTPSYTSMKFNGGTSRYIAPERKGPSGKSSPGSDLWSLGVIIGQLAPFAGKESGKFQKLAAKCQLPLEERVSTATEMKFFLQPRKSNVSFLWIGVALSLASAIFLVLLLLDTREEEAVEIENTKARIEESDRVGSVITGARQESRVANPTEGKDTEKANGSKVRKTDSEDVKPVKESVKTDDGTGYDRNQYLSIAKNRAVTIAEKRMREFERENEGAPQTPEMMVASQTAYYEIMKEIASFVATLDIPTDEDRQRIIREAQSEADAFIRLHMRSLQ